MRQSNRSVRGSIPAFLGTSTDYSSCNFDTLTALEAAKLTHVPPVGSSDKVCLHAIRGLRWIADKLFQDRYIHRGFMLLGMSCAAPAAVAVAEHLRSLWRGKAPIGLRVNLSHYENKRTHFAILSELVPPNRVDILITLLAQTIHFAAFFFLTLLSPRTSYRLLAYFNEEASVILTHLINDIDLGKISDRDAPSSALAYWGLKPSTSTAASSVAESSGATDRSGETSQEAASRFGLVPPSLRDVVLLIRGDEMTYRDLNHALADQHETNGSSQAVNAAQAKQ